jgi:hypothetical protein
LLFNETWADNLNISQHYRPAQPVTGLDSLSFTLLHLLYSVDLVRKRTKPTDQPRLVGEVSANICGYRVSRGQHGWFLLP